MLISEQHRQASATPNVVIRAVFNNFAQEPGMALTFGMTKIILAMKDRGTHHHCHAWGDVVRSDSCDQIRWELTPVNRRDTLGLLDVQLWDREWLSFGHEASASERR
jgi:hypothetical protein